MGTWTNEPSRSHPARQSHRQYRLLLADDFFFAAHDNLTGKLRLTERGAGLGLAAALLGELTLFRRISIGRARVQVLDHHPPRDRANAVVLERLLAESEPQLVLDWLRFLCRDAHELVGRRMAAGGYLQVKKGKLRRATSYVPTDVNVAAWPITRLSVQLANTEPVSLPDTVLAGLLLATGLDSHLRSEADSDIQGYLSQLISRLPPSLRSLVAETEAAIGEAVLHHRI